MVSLSWHIGPDPVTNNFPHLLIIFVLSFPEKCVYLFFFQVGNPFPTYHFLSHTNYVIDCDNYCEPNLYS